MDFVEKGGRGREEWVCGWFTNGIALQVKKEEMVEW
jgi:hypothetical protein